MIKFKGCPKCGGDLYLKEDMFGKFLDCLQCGYLKDVSAEKVEAGKLETEKETVLAESQAA